MDKYVLTCGEEYGSEYIISIYDTLEDAQQATLKYMLNEYEQMMKCTNSKAKWNPTIEWTGDYKFYYTKKNHMKYQISLVEYNKQEFINQWGE